MLGCDGAKRFKCPGNGWYHADCLGIDFKAASALPEYYCDACDKQRMASSSSQKKHKLAPKSKPKPKPKPKPQSQSKSQSQSQSHSQSKPQSQSQNENGQQRLESWRKLKQDFDVEIERKLIEIQANMPYDACAIRIHLKHLSEDFVRKWKGKLGLRITDKDGCVSDAEETWGAVKMELDTRFRNLELNNMRKTVSELHAEIRLKKIRLKHSEEDINSKTRERLFIDTEKLKKQHLKILKFEARIKKLNEEIKNAECSSSSESKKDRCGFCGAGNREAVLRCGHCCCLKCAGNMQRTRASCPKCRAPFKQFVKLYDG